MSRESRRKPRRNPDRPILVVDTMTGGTVGQIGNLSETGMLLIADLALMEDALYQFAFRLPWPDGSGERDCETGAHVLWIEERGTSGKAWAGVRFIATPAEHAAHLHDWMGAQTQG